MAGVYVTETVSVPEAAKVLGFGRNTIYDAIKSGKFPAVKIGNGIRVSKEYVQKLLDDAKQPPR